LDVIGMVLDVGMVVEPLRSAVDIVEGAADDSIFAKIAVKSAYVEPVDDPREAGALAECAVKAEAACAGWGVEGDRLSVAEPHGEVRNRRLLVLQPRREVAASRDERVSFVNQVAREGPGEGSLVW
jgi:hypothetical protein